MKKVIIRALFKALCCFALMILITIGFQYYVWVRYYPEYRMDKIMGSSLGPSTISPLTTRKQVQDYVDKELGIPSHFTPDLWPFSDDNWYPGR